MIKPHMVDDALKRLAVMAAPSVRLDYRVTAQLAQRVINDLVQGEVAESRRLTYIAKQISERAAVRPQVVYRTLRTKEIRWLSVAGVVGKRIRPEQIIGTYDEGNDWKAIRDDLEVEA